MPLRAHGSAFDKFVLCSVFYLGQKRGDPLFRPKHHWTHWSVDVHKGLNLKEALIPVPILFEVPSILELAVLRQQ